MKSLGRGKREPALLPFLIVRATLFAESNGSLKKMFDAHTPALRVTRSKTSTTRVKNCEKLIEHGTTVSNTEVLYHFIHTFCLKQIITLHLHDNHHLIELGIGSFFYCIGKFVYQW